jgi:dipeptidyl aminopeptidase/acylaminoacyl peptidase
MERVNLEKAFQLMPEKAEAMVLNGNFRPWFLDEQRFVYVKESFLTEGKKSTYLIHDIKSGEEQEAFDQEELAKLLSKEKNTEVSANQLPIVFETLNEEGHLLFTTPPGNSAVMRYCFDGKQLIPQMKPMPNGAVLSPDKTKAVYGAEGNLYLLDLKTGVEKALTKDGVSENGYGILCANASGVIATKLKGNALPLGAFWSEDNRFVFTYKMDLRKVETYTLVQSVPQGDEAVRPVVHTYHYPLPGDAHLPMVEYFRIDLQEDRCQSFGLGSFAFSGTIPGSFGDSIEGNYTIFQIKNRQNTLSNVYVMNHEDQTTKLLFTEISPTFIFLDHYKMQNASANSSDFVKRKYYLSEKLDSLFWLSERHGWFDLYQYCLQDGSCKQLTDGYTIRQILHIDSEQKLLYFSASNCGLGETPYQKYPYCLNLTTGTIECLRAEPGDHETHFSPNAEYYLDIWTSYHREPVVTLYTISNQVVRVISRSDASRLRDAGYVEPTPFCVKAADGTTDIHGMLFFPPNFDAEKSYPVVEYCYGGNQKMLAPQTFMESLSRHAGYTQTLANLGFIAIIIDGRGTPLRGKAFHDHCYNNMGACAGIDDHEAAYQQLKLQYPAMDVDRVGVWGHSGGGFATYQFMVKKPHLYKVGVSTAGNHAQEIYSASWSELFMEPFRKELWKAQNAEFLAENLQGHLLLIHGDLDDNVHPANTIRIVNALINADKDFDLLIIPNRHHDLHDHPYYRRRLIEYFIRHLNP